MSMRNQKEIAHAFRHHAPCSEATIQKHVLVRSECHDLAQKLFEICPGCDDTTLALRAVERAMMYANAAIARNQLEEP